MDEKKNTQQPRTGFKYIVRSEVFAAAYWVGAFALMVVFSYFQWFKSELQLPLSENPAVWGAFGDYVGGILNPVCAYMAFLWLVRSYALQKTELVETRDALQLTQAAQQRQADVAYAAARIDAANIRLSITTIQGSTCRLELSEAKAAYARGVLSGEYKGAELPYQHVINFLKRDLLEIERVQLEILSSIETIEISMLAKAT
jgi:hypothetical protein